VTVTITGRPAVAPEAEHSNPVIHAVVVAVAVNVATALALA
jgi:hypothetical protein